jgi:nucleotide-binding universal stress UspA family protein
MERFATSLLGQAEILLLATDGSHYSDGAVQEAIFFGQACAAKVVALHVVKVQSESLTSAEGVLRRRRQELEPYLQGLRRMAKDSGVALETVVIGSTHPEQAILEQARQRRADVILMGRHGRAGRLSLLIGRMTSRVIEIGFPKVLVVPKDFIISGARLLLAMGHGPGAERAVEEVISLGRSSRTLQQVIVLATAGKATELSACETLMHEICEKIEATGTPALCRGMTVFGEPVAAIIDTARREQCDMIVIGGCCRRGVAGVLLGRIARRVTGKAHCAVLVVNAAP